MGLSVITVKDAGDVARNVRTRELSTNHQQVVEGVEVTPYANPDVGITGVVVSSVASILHNWAVFSSADVYVYLKIYDKATAAVATDTPKLIIAISPTQQNTNHAASNGYAFANGISIRATTGPTAGAGDTGAPGTNAVIANLGYRPA